MKKRTIICGLGTMLLLGVGVMNAAPASPDSTWTDPELALREDPDFAVQGEYRDAKNESAPGVQVAALGDGKFSVQILENGLPGAGWLPGMSRTLLKGKHSNNGIHFADEAGKSVATIRDGQLNLTYLNGTKHTLSRIERQSPTLEAKPPPGAVVLFDGTSVEHWENGRMVDAHFLAAGCTSKRVFGDYTLHLEFRTPYKPGARGQERGNSGIYHSGRWETQILDSFGFGAGDNDCGGIYSVSKPRFNMCLPPLVWQTYDVEFVAAKFDASGARTAWPRITVRLNGVLVHEDLELSKDFTTSARISRPLKGPEGPVHLQQHKNPVVFRNIWLVPGETAPLCLGS
ncbi:MAG: DUF1080 domain-containing protein [Akkermansiaceae bacterium]